MISQSKKGDINTEESNEIHLDTLSNPQEDIKDMENRNLIENRKKKKLSIIN